jgi:hypothetical protein
MTTDLWTFGAIAPEGSEKTDIAGYTVAAIDGDNAGRVTEAIYEPGSSCIVVETGPWLLGRRVLIPAALVRSMDDDERTIAVSLTKEQIKESPTPDPDVGDLTCQESRDDVQEFFEGVAGASQAP